MNQLALAEAFARLQALKANLPDGYYADQKYIHEFHEILGQLQQASGMNLLKYQVPDNEIRPQESGGNYITAKVYGTGRTVCERSFLMMKIDAVAGFFSFELSPQKKTIGFSPSD